LTNNIIVINLKERKWLSSEIVAVMAEHSAVAVVVLAEAIANRVASREAETDKVVRADVAAASKRAAVVVAPAEVAGSEAVGLDVVVPVARVVARDPVTTLLLTRTCFSTGTRPVSRTSVRRQRCFRRKSSTVSSKSTTLKWLLEELLLLINRLLEPKLQPNL
jgi:hypothetical protein